MSKRISLNAGESVGRGTGLDPMTAAGNPWTLDDGLADELVNRGKAIYTDAPPSKPVINRGAALSDGEAPVSVRQVASHCRYPNILNGVRQATGRSRHRAGITLTEFAAGFVNYYSASEQPNGGTLTVFTAVEWPIGSGNMRLLTYGGTTSGNIVPGGEILSDYIDLLNMMVPQGEWFDLWHYHYNAAGGGIPTCKGGPYPMTNDATYGLYRVQGGQYPQINHILTSTSAQRLALTNTDSTGTDQITPICIVARGHSSATATVPVARDIRRLPTC